METSTLIIGSGIAGLTAAMYAKGNVMVATKEKVLDSNTLYAQGGLAAVFSTDDNAEAHVQDTVRAGDGLTNKRIAAILAKESPKRVLELKKIGVHFDQKQKHFSLSREAVHSRARIVHSSDTTGKAIQTVLVKRVKQKATILEEHMAIDLIMDKGACLGCRFLTPQGVEDIFASNTIITTGGIGQLYARTTNPEVATADGIALAFRAGAVLEDMEFVQFHPTMLHNSSPSFLISETLRGEGGLLKNRFGKTYMSSYHRDGELAPRDVVSKFSVEEMKKTGAKNVFLDMTHLDANFLKRRFPHIYQRCLSHKIDLTKKMIPVSPAAHYLCGGIKTDDCGQTNIKNLFAVGECACTQLHGADRLASNSLAEGAVFGKRAVQKMTKQKIRRIELPPLKLSTMKNGKIKKIRNELRKVMWNQVGIIKTKKRLQDALKKIKRWEAKTENGINKNSLELKNMLLVAKIIILASLRRKESRGTHFIKDYPERHDSIWQKHLQITKNSPKFS
ncbi:L-aspartate oxidase [Candidatus Woesearchaeota archaeon]|nr:L-aspartate oxidase [Candidatus Woesearchaeota archaeon]